MLSKEASSTIFESLVWLALGLNLGLPGHWRTLYPPGQWACYKVNLATVFEGDPKAPFSYIHNVILVISYTHTHTHTHTYIYIYIILFVCLLACYQWTCNGSLLMKRGIWTSFTSRSILMELVSESETHSTLGGVWMI